MSCYGLHYRAINSGQPGQAALNDNSYANVIPLLVSGNLVTRLPVAA